MDFRVGEFRKEFFFSKTGQPTASFDANTYFIERYLWNPPITERNVHNWGRTISGPASRHALRFKVLFGTQNAGHFVPDSTPLSKNHFEGRVKLRVPSPIPLSPGSSSSTGKYLNVAVPVLLIPSNRPVPLTISLVVLGDAAFKMPNPLSTGGLL